MRRGRGRATPGAGMTPEFVRERLFKPFETTKPAGMGIGVYESSQYVQELGGRDRRSTARRDEGTRVRVAAACPDGEPARAHRAAGAAAGTSHERKAQAAADRRGRSGAAEADALGVRAVRDRGRRATANRAIAQLRRYEPRRRDHGPRPAAGIRTIRPRASRCSRRSTALAPDTKVIVLTGQNDRANALRAIGLGAYDFCTKPFEPELLALTIDRAFRLHELQEENRRLQSLHAAARHGRASSRAIRRCSGSAARSRRSRRTSATVLILGE